MRFSIIGTGNLAWFLAQKLTKSGHQCSCVYGRDIEKARKLADTVNSEPTDRLRDIRDQDDAVIIAVADSAIEQTAARVFADHAVLIHTAGAAGMDLLGEAPNKAVIWPIYSIIKNSLPPHRDIPTAIEANNMHSGNIARNLAHAFTDRAFAASRQQRLWLHLCAVIGNNFINHLMALDEQICKEQNMDFSVLQPILQQTFERIQSASPQQLQTGPAIRHDEVTINRHLVLLEQNPALKNLYQSITASIQQTHPSPIGGTND